MSHDTTAEIAGGPAMSHDTTTAAIAGTPT